MRIARFPPLLLVSVLVCGCLFSSQVVIGPTVDERGDVGGMVRVHVVYGATYLNLMATGEVSGRQASPHALLATGVGLFSQIDLPNDYTLLGNIRLALVGSTSWRSGSGSSIGGAVALARYVKTKGRYSDPMDHWEGWAIGGELACDRQFGLGSQDMVLSPGFIFEYLYFANAFK